MMHSRVLLFAAVLMVLIGSSLGCAKMGARGESGRAGKKADVELILFITSDGFRTDYVEWYDPPVIKELIGNGVRVRESWPVFPPNTTANMSALATGAYPKTSGVAHNNQYVRELDRIAGGARPTIPTIATTLTEAGWRTAAVSHFVFETRGVERDMYFDAQTYHFDDTAAPGRVADATIGLIDNGSANFIAINFGATDSVGHHYGPKSQEAKDMVLAVDAAIGRIVEALKEKGLFEKTLITMNADHGMSQIESRNVSMEPAEALRQAGFKVAATQDELAEDTEIIVLKGGLRIVYFRKDLSEEEEQRVMDALNAIDGAMVMDRFRLRELHCHPDHGDLFVHPLPGYTIEGAGSTGGQHGRWTEMNPILFFHGPGIRKGAWVERSDNVDVVPTLLHLVGVEPADTVDGKVIWGALAP